jgi:protein Mpv17
MINLFRRLLYLPSIAFSDKYLLATNVTISMTLSSVGMLNQSFFERKIFEVMDQLTKTSFAILGDILEQHYEIYKKEMERWDRKRTFNMAASGVTVGIFCHNWYNFLQNKS